MFCLCRFEFWRDFSWDTVYLFSCTRADGLANATTGAAARHWSKNELGSRQYSISSW